MAAVGEARHLVGAAPVSFWHHQPAEVTEAGRGEQRQPRRSLEKVRAGRGGPSYNLEIAEEGQEEEYRRLLEHKPAQAGYRGPGQAAARGAAGAPASSLLPRFASSSRFPRPDPNLFDKAKLERFEEELFTSMLPSTSDQAAMDRNLVMECLRLYNSMHPGNEYEPAPGVVTAYSSPHNGSCWTHGNFVARPKRSGCFSFLPAPRVLFFYELVTKDDFKGAVSCTPLNEPVTEACSLLGFRLGWGTRRNGRSDCLCSTCYRLVDRQVPFAGKTFPCGHNKAKCICEMCHVRSEVLHPLPGEFAYPNHDWSCR